MNMDKILNLLEIHLRNPRSLAPFTPAPKTKSRRAFARRLETRKRND